MSRQNRVTPFGEIVAVRERGTLMGNRGILHDPAAEDDPDARIRRRWASRAWIACLLEFRGRRAPVMAPGHYTRLFFLDEPTALAAGHRPCAECRRADFVAFRDAWTRGTSHPELGARPLAVEIDRVLHDERIGPGRTKRTYQALMTDLPDGAFVSLPAERLGHAPADSGLAAFLRWQGALWRWSPGGYTARLPLPVEPVTVLTPPSIVAALAAGYTPGSWFEV